MKLSKIVRLPANEGAKIEYGTVDFKKFNSLFLNITTWIMPLCDDDLAKKELNLLPYRIRQHVMKHLDRSLYRDRFISDVDVKLSGIKENKKSFISMELTLFNKANIEFKSPTIKKSMFTLSNSIVKNFIVNDNNFNFFLSKGT